MAIIALGFTAFTLTEAGGRDKAECGSSTDCNTGICTHDNSSSTKRRCVGNGNYVGGAVS
ncbi:uncharacterized protein RAG0_00919 [Rhynchosporium agropyri]|uniref:Uncharacterized protein n=1 Tax=Rhynchosporium agropyri TaxID=914238 RepID=A0A1E1JV75_9HELO|nr:uncharacterized protein RAG0_00919 [Rhynchosporium agropyri]